MSFVEAGNYVLEVGDPAGTRVVEGTTPTPSGGTELPELSHAIEADDAGFEPGASLAEAGADLVDDVSAKTAEVERAVEIGKGLAKGEALDPAQLGLQLDALLGLVERLDREGRWKEALRLARALSTLYSLLRRWAALLRSLRAALRAGEALGDLKAIGWAKHELGTLRIAAGDTGGAARYLGEARKLREQLGDRRGLAATDHNLRRVCERLRGGSPGEGRLLRLSLPVAALFALLLLTGGLAGGELVDRVRAGGDGDGGTVGDANGRLLSVELAGGGSGSVVSEPPGIECGNSCTASFERGQEVTLTAVADDGSVFDRFAGACSGGSPCELALQLPAAVRATFAPAHTLTVTVQGPGTVEGRAAGGSGRISCSAEPVDNYDDALPRVAGNRCSADFPEGVVVQLTADGEWLWKVKPGKECGPGNTCRVTMTTFRDVTAVFGPLSRDRRGRTPLEDATRGP